MFIFFKSQDYIYEIGINKYLNEKLFHFIKKLKIYTEKLYRYSKENFENERKRKLKRKLEKKTEIELRVHEKEKRKKFYEKEKLKSLKKLNKKKKIPIVKDKKNEKCEKTKNHLMRPGESSKQVHHGIQHKKEQHVEKDWSCIWDKIGQNCCKKYILVSQLCE